MDNKTLTVKVMGLPNCGKTTVARLIESKLKEEGFTDVLVSDVGPSDIPKEVIDIRIAATKKRRVRIDVEQLQGAPDGKSTADRVLQTLIDARQKILDFGGFQSCPTLIDEINYSIKDVVRRF